MGPASQRFGAHMSIAGGLHKAFLRAGQIGCDCLQIFVKNQRQWHGPPITDQALDQWQRTRRNSPVQPIVAHAAYLINLASPDRQLWRRSLQAFLDELQRCQKLGIGDLVIHPGAHGGSGISAAIQRVAHALDAAHQQLGPPPVRILLETTAGQGSAIGHRLEHLADIVARTRRPARLGLCLDTAHLFAAGYSLADPDGYHCTIDAVARIVGLQRVHCLHLNDSKTPCGSRVDRHEHIGRGKIGLSGFALLLNDPRLAALPRILETPKGKDARGRDYDALNLARLRRLVQI